MATVNISFGTVGIQYALGGICSDVGFCLLATTNMDAATIFRSHHRTVQCIYSKERAIYAALSSRNCAPVCAGVFIKEMYLIIQLRNGSPQGTHWNLWMESVWTQSDGRLYCAKCSVSLWGRLDRMDTVPMG
ncbi:unnamed protein product [Ostreobium quekettii]|uniref:Uncharacterized protein n=1 Tax=Ostreobium quekettii TaxID=121088 RepID=A0A8S1JCH7_9CHLO|nr:unnamed protein product [Ostreobium quekettii]